VYVVFPVFPAFRVVFASVCASRVRRCRYFYLLVPVGRGRSVVYVVFPVFAAFRVVFAFVCASRVRRCHAFVCAPRVRRCRYFYLLVPVGREVEHAAYALHSGLRRHALRASGFLALC
jgi:hypothetical protein